MLAAGSATTCRPRMRRTLSARGCPYSAAVDGSTGMLAGITAAFLRSYARAVYGEAGGHLRRNSVLRAGTALMDEQTVHLDRVSSNGAGS